MMKRENQSWNTERINNIPPTVIRTINTANQVWFESVIGTSRAVRKYCAKTMAFDALNLDIEDQRVCLFRFQRYSSTHDISITVTAKEMETRNLGRGYACSR